MSDGLRKSACLSDAGSYVEDKLKDDKTFDAKGLIAKDPSYEGRLKYWDNELCRKYPHTFDFVLSVG